MVKLTDLEGAKEALPKRNDADCNDYKDIDFEMGFNSACDSLNNIHLEVDVEAMAKEMWKTKNLKTKYLNCPNNEYRNITFIEFRKLVRDCVSTTIPKWARLVRK